MTSPLRRVMINDEKIFSFLNNPIEFNPDHFDWFPRGVGKLWRYKLHYFDYLQEENRPAQSKASLIENWISNVIKGTEDAWEPFPVSLRIVNWIKWFLSPETDSEIRDIWLLSLYEQTLWLERNMEYHLLANHLFKNGKSLLFAGLYFEGTDAEMWLKKGMEIVLQELREQILPDGGHFERSPMYHSMILEDCLDLLNLCKGWEAGRLGNWDCRGSGKSLTTKRHNDNVKNSGQIDLLVQTLEAKVEKMASFLWGMTHPDGRIALFNDATFGIEAEPEDLFSYYERVTGESIKREVPRIRSFPESGYYLMSPRTGDRLIIDCGPVGPDYQLSHCHCDTLSFELSLNGHRVVVDSGCYQYEASKIRSYNRGNAGHNTITVDGQNQSEVWSAHRCGRRAYPISSKLYEDETGSLIFEGAHDGYRRLTGSPVHHRKVQWTHDHIRIEDRIDGKGDHTIESRLHIHPDMRLVFKGNSVEINMGDKLVTTVSIVGPGRLEVEKGWYCPEFGIKHACPALRLIFEREPLPINTGWRFVIHRD